MPFVTALLTTRVRGRGISLPRLPQSEGGQLCSSGFTCVYRMCLDRSNSTQSRHTVSFSHFSLHHARLTSEDLCHFLSQVSISGPKQEPPLWSQLGSRSQIWACIKAVVGSLTFARLKFNNFTFHFSRCRSGLLLFTLQMLLPSLILFHQVALSSKNVSAYTNQKRKRGRKAHIFHLSGHSTTQSQGTSWMSRTIRVNDKSEVVHSLGKHSPHKTETGRQTLTCPKLITCVEANTHTRTCTHSSSSIRRDNDGNLTDTQNCVIIKIRPDLLRKKLKDSESAMCSIFRTKSPFQRNARDLCLFVLHYCAMWSMEIDWYTTTMYMTELLWLGFLLIIALQK